MCSARLLYLFIVLFCSYNCQASDSLQLRISHSLTLSHIISKQEKAYVPAQGYYITNTPILGQSACISITKSKSNHQFVGAGLGYSIYGGSIFVSSLNRQIYETFHYVYIPLLYGVHTNKQIVNWEANVQVSPAILAEHKETRATGNDLSIFRGNTDEKQRFHVSSQNKFQCITQLSLGISLLINPKTKVVFQPNYSRTLLNFKQTLREFKMESAGFTTSVVVNL